MLMHLHAIILPRRKLVLKMCKSYPQGRALVNALHDAVQYDDALRQHQNATQAEPANEHMNRG